MGTRYTTTTTVVGGPGNEVTKVPYEGGGVPAGGLKEGGGKEGKEGKEGGRQRLETERVYNVMGSCAGAGSGDFHMYRHTRRTEMTRLENMEQKALEDELDAEFERRVAEKRKECEERTARNVEKRRRKKERARLRAAAPPPPLPNDGSFLERAKAALAHPDAPGA